MGREEKVRKKSLKQRFTLGDQSVLPLTLLQAWRDLPAKLLVALLSRKRADKTKKTGETAQTVVNETVMTNSTGRWARRSAATGQFQRDPSTAQSSQTPE